MARRHRLGFLPSIFLLTSSCTFLAYHTLKLRYHLPEPLDDLVNNQTGRPQISERTILEDAAYLSESIGYRTVGTREHAEGDQWMLSQATRLKEACDSIAGSDPTRHLECEVFRQEGSGAHRFDMMDRRVYKNYVNLSNIIFRISNGTSAGKEHALLVNSHLDSTLPSPGAADDALPAALMLDCIRVLINTPDWTPHYALVFLWNNAEESLQDGSHLFSTQGDLGSTVRAVINLEAAGTSGPELLFQATSEEMIEAYSHVPRPFGSVVANDVFRSGIILSDTDFRQFQEYRNLTGLDMAVVGDSYLYHTRRDLVENIEKGVAQHMGENVLALLEYLSSADSPIPRLDIYSSPRVAYLSLGGQYFLTWSFKTAQRLYNSILVVSALIFFGLVPSRIGLRTYSVVAFGVFGGLVGAIVGANVVALIMTRVLDAGLSWFAVKWSPLVLYSVPALVGVLIIQYISACLLSPHDAHLEYGTFIVLHLLFATSGVVLQYLGIASGVAGFCWAMSSFSALLVQFALSTTKSTEDITLPAYFIAQLIPSTLGMEMASTLMDIFVPLTGRMGNEAPAEHIIATMVAVMTFLVVPFSIPFVHRFSRKALLVSILVLMAVSAGLIAVFSSSWLQTFDHLHPRRIFLLHQEDITTGEYSLHVGLVDSAPGIPGLIRDIGAAFGSNADGFEPQAVVMDDWNKDWDILYPFSQFLEPYKIPLPPPSGDYVSPWTSSSAFRVTAVKDVFDAIAGTRELSLVIDHPGIIWSVIAFDAHVLSWQLDKNPLPYFARHHIKEASFYGVDQWTLDLVINATPTGERPILKVDFQGIQEKGMWPAKKAERQGPAMDLFEQLDAWLDERPGVAFDALLLGCVSGVAIM